MRKIRELLRLKFDLGLSIRQIAASLSMARSTVTDLEDQLRVANELH